MFRPRPSTLLLAAALLAGSAVAGCASDGDELSSTACDAYAAAQASFFGDPAAIATSFEALAGAVPTTLADDARVLAGAAGSDDPSAFESPAVAAASRRLGDAVFDGCATVAKADVDGVDYAFEGLPREMKAGRVAIRLENETASGQPHELVIVTGTEGQRAEDLRGLPMEELMTKARPVAVAFAAAPNDRATTLVDLDPGSYLVLCSLPVDAGADAPKAPSSDTHANHGMVATLTVA